MNSRQVAVIAGFVMVLGALVLLLVEVNASPEVEVPEDALAQARARYQREQRASPASRPAVRAPAAPVKRAPTRAKRSAKRSDDAARSAGNTRSRRRVPTLEVSPPRARAEDESSAAAQVTEIRNLYDRGRYDEALDLAEAHLRRDPDQRYVRRVAVTSACALGDADAVRSLMEGMSPADERIVRLRCARFGLEI